MSIIKNLSLSIGLVALGLSLQAQNQTSCCMAATNTGEFSQFAKDQNFKAAHEEPIPFILENPKGKMVTFPITGGKAGNAYMVKANPTSDKYIFVIHEWWGLNDYIKQEADKLAEAIGANVLALDMYDGKLATTREEAAAAMQAVDEKRAESIVLGAKNFAGKNAKIATIGWCFGGGWSLRSSLLLGDQAKACIIYYGNTINDAEKLANLKAPVLGIFASQDAWINPEMVEGFKTAMTAASKKVEVNMYNADHAFANPSNPKYDAKATQDAWMKSLNFLMKNLFE